MPKEIIPLYLYQTRYYAEPVSLQLIYLDFCEIAGKTPINYEDIEISVGDEPGGGEFSSYAVRAEINKEVGTCENKQYDYQMNLYWDRLQAYEREMQTYEARNDKHKQIQLAVQKSQKQYYLDAAKANLQMAGVKYTIEDETKA